MCDDAGVPAARLLAFTQALDGMLVRDPAARWSAQDALHVLNTGLPTAPHDEILDGEPMFIGKRAFRRSVSRILTHDLCLGDTDVATAISTACFEDVDEACVYARGETERIRATKARRAARSLLVVFAKTWQTMFV
jgi:hypothetical protein